MADKVKAGDTVHVRLDAARINKLEAMRVSHGFRSWSEVVRLLIDSSHVRAEKSGRGRSDA